MKIYNKVSLRELNTFGIDVTAKLMVDCHSVDDMSKVSEMCASDKCFVLGGGSNVLFLGDYDGVIVRPLIDWIEVVDRTADTLTLRVGAGVEWDAFVEHCVNNGLYGVENLSGIPGNVGASPVQNIGAYGAEVGNVISAVRGFWLKSGKPFAIDGRDCAFGYRDSVFKSKYRGEGIITTVDFKLRRKGELNLSYGPVAEAVAANGGASLANVRKAIIDIRNSKLPDPKVEGNAGSFFKNPEVEGSVVEALLAQYPRMPHFALDGGRYKVPAGWLIEQAGWKGRSLGPCAVHDKQALVIVNKGGAVGADVVRIANAVRADVKGKFGIDIVPEVNWVEP